MASMIETKIPTTSSPDIVDESTSTKGKKRPAPVETAEFEAKSTDGAVETPATKRAKRVEGIREKLRAVLADITTTAAVRKKAERLIDRLVNEAVRTRRPSKVLNDEVTMQNYAKRIAEIGVEEFGVLDGKWMSLYGGMPKDAPISIEDLGSVLGENHVLTVLAKVAKAKGVSPKGGVSASMKKNDAGEETFIVSSIPEGERAYVGPTLAFKGLMASPFSLKNVDKVYASKPKAGGEEEATSATAKKNTVEKKPAAKKTGEKKAATKKTATKKEGK